MRAAAMLAIQKNKASRHGSGTDSSSEEIKTGRSNALKWLEESETRKKGVRGIGCQFLFKGRTACRYSRRGKKKKDGVGEKERKGAGLDLAGPRVCTNFCIVRFINSNFRKEGAPKGEEE